jgi:deazaflavin-dependent oxidoreductase (nitroreductase family)
MATNDARISTVAAQLAASGRVAVLETHGRRSGTTAIATVGFVEEADGALLVAAGDPDADWALNLLAEPACNVRIGTDRFACSAQPLDRAGLAVAVRELILKYGTASEGLGAGPAFRLRPTTGHIRP